MYIIQILIMVVVGLFINVQYYDDYVSIQPNNRYTWVEYDSIHYNLGLKEVFVYCGDKLTIGVN